MARNATDVTETLMSLSRTLAGQVAASEHTNATLGQYMQGHFGHLS